MISTRISIVTRISISIRIRIRISLRIRIRISLTIRIRIRIRGERGLAERTCDTCDNISFIRRTVSSVLRWLYRSNWKHKAWENISTLIQLITKDLKKKHKRAASPKHI